MTKEISAADLADKKYAAALKADILVYKRRLYPKSDYFKEGSYTCHLFKLKGLGHDVAVVGHANPAFVPKLEYSLSLSNARHSRYRLQLPLQ